MEKFLPLELTLSESDKNYLNFIKSIEEKYGKNFYKISMIPKEYLIKT